MLLSQLPAYFKTRRDRLMSSHPGAVFLFPSAEEYLRNPDVHHPFRQESNFHYLTGFDEPESFAVLREGRLILFVRHRDPEKEMWEGERYGTEGALKIFGADEAYPIGELERKLPELIGGADQVYYRMGVSEAVDRRVLGCLETVRRSQGRSGKSLAPLLDPNEKLGELRIFKSSEEIALMRKACRVSALAHKAAMVQVRPGQNEAELEALVDYEMRRHGCERLGYGSIVAGGRNATCLHYRSNNDRLNDRELLLIDAGGEHGYYTADITRTFPVGREFTPAQARIYDWVLKAQVACVEMVKPGVTMPQIHRRAVEILTEGMLELGLLHPSQGTRDELIASAAFRRYFPHGTGHWLGMDVHDVGLYQVPREGQGGKGEPRPLEAGMVFTIEPGLYVQPGDTQAPAEYRDIGVRIEDDILVTPTGYENLTADAPKGREEIENLKRA